MFQWLGCSIRHFTKLCPNLLIFTACRIHIMKITASENTVSMGQATNTFLSEPVSYWAYRMINCGSLPVTWGMVPVLQLSEAGNRLIHQWALLRWRELRWALAQEILTLRLFHTLWKKQVSRQKK